MKFTLFTPHLKKASKIKGFKTSWFSLSGLFLQVFSSEPDKEVGTGVTIFSKTVLFNLFGR